MASLPDNYIKSCHDKTDRGNWYTNYWSANKAICSMAKQGKVIAEEMTAYACRCCGNIHIGHKSKHSKRK